MIGRHFCEFCRDRTVAVCGCDCYGAALYWLQQAKRQRGVSKWPTTEAAGYVKISKHSLKWKLEYEHERETNQLRIRLSWYVT